MFLMNRNPYRDSPPPAWRNISEAPKDGTPIEIQNNWGVAPHYGLCKWVDGRGWIYTNNENMGMGDGSHLSWRPYDGDQSSYADPTNGDQDTPEYWRRACGL